MKPMLNNTFLNSEELPEFRSKSQALYFALNIICSNYPREEDYVLRAKEMYAMILNELPSLPEFAPKEPAIYPFQELNNRKFSYGNFVPLGKVPISDVMVTQREQFNKLKDINDGYDKCPTTTDTESPEPAKSGTDA